MRWLILVNGMSLGQWVQSLRPRERTGTRGLEHVGFWRGGNVERWRLLRRSQAARWGPVQVRGRDAGVEDQGGRGRSGQGALALKFLVVSWGPCGPLHPSPWESSESGPWVEAGPGAGAGSRYLRLGV